MTRPAQHAQGRVGGAQMSSLKTVVIFTLAYGMVAVCLLAGQPSAGTVQTADAGGNFEVPTSHIAGFMIRLASAETPHLPFGGCATKLAMAHRQRPGDPWRSIQLNGGQEAAFFLSG